MLERSWSNLRPRHKELKIHIMFILQTHPTQQVVSVSSTEQPAQSQILLQCRSTGLDLTAPALHPTKLLPQPTTSNVEKEDIFLRPKVHFSCIYILTSKIFLKR